MLEKEDIGRSFVLKQENKSFVDFLSHYLSPTCVVLCFVKVKTWPVPIGAALLGEGGLRVPSMATPSDSCEFCAAQFIIILPGVFIINIGSLHGLVIVIVGNLGSLRNRWNRTLWQRQQCRVEGLKHVRQQGRMHRKYSPGL